MQYKLKFGSGGSIVSWRESSRPALGQWTPTSKPFGPLNTPDLSWNEGADWTVGTQHLILEAHHLSDVIKGLRKYFARTSFLLPERRVHIQHQYWQSPRRQNTLTFQNLTSPGYRAMAEKARHRHRFVLGTGTIAGRGDWNANLFRLDRITGEELALAIEGNKASIRKAGNINQDVGEEIGAAFGTVGSIFGL